MSGYVRAVRGERVQLEGGDKCIVPALVVSILAYNICLAVDQRLQEHYGSFRNHLKD